MNVFVYGTLKRGHRNFHWMERADGMFICEAKLTGVKMYSCGSFPAIAFGHEGEVKGEIFAVEKIEELDLLEGYPRFYNRIEVDTSYGKAWVYFLDENKLENWSEVPSGVWE